MPEITKKEQNLGIFSFIKETASYFMDFLETDFHRRRFPRRNIKFRNEDNLLIGLNLQKYPNFEKLIWKVINKGFEKDVLNKISKGVYKTNLPENLLNLVKLQIEKIAASKINKIIEKIGEEIEKNGTLYAKEYDIALTTSIQQCAQIIKEGVVRSIIENIEKPLQNLNLGDEDHVLIIEEELTNVLSHSLENKISEMLNRFIAKEKVVFAKEIKTVFDHQEVKNTINSFFENLQVADLFLELFEMERNKNILDKQEFYLYFGDISYGGVKYPIFYIPFELIRDGDNFNVEFDSQVYVNKKALEFIVQEYNTQKGTKGALQAISERIIYLSQNRENFSTIIGEIINEISNFFELKNDVDFFHGERMIARGASVRISNNCYVCLFDKSDEALVNDYEEILQQLNAGGGILGDIFNKIIDDFICKNPKVFNQEVEEEWDGSDAPDKLTYTSPIPLNSEQRQILSAVRKDNCKYIIVEGPPGTGKSHTITAIVFDAILKNQAVLVLSDKKEALDVVEEKITETMNKVRFDKNFQNPILRLGKTGNTYNSILTKSSIDDIKTHYRAVRKDYETISNGIKKSVNSLKDDLEAEILAYDEINIKEIQEFFDLEIDFRDKELIFDLEELKGKDEAVDDLVDLQNSINQIKGILIAKEISEIFDLLNLNPKDLHSCKDFDKFLHFLALTIGGIKKIKTTFSDKIDFLNNFSQFSSKDLPELNNFIEKYSKLKLWGLGYLFSGKRADGLDSEFKESFIYSDLSQPHKKLQELKNLYEIYTYAQKLGFEIGKGLGEFDFVALVHKLLTNTTLPEVIQNIILVLEESISYLKGIEEKYPKTANKLSLNSERFESLMRNKVTEISEIEFNKQIRYLNLNQKLNKDFSGIPELNYATRMRQIEDLVTTQVTYLLDERVINFYEQSKADAEALKNIIRNKQRFPRDEFIKLKEAFPCILAGIRDYAEYIPLEQEIFDLVIIDEASQVSIAQAFPALLRAKKVLILGDRKQFGNIKASQARTDTNHEYLNGLETSFKRNVSSEPIKLERLKKFNIKTSILEFFEFICNYTTRLQKYFRGYKEIISYSNKYFYQNSLQVMKIRGKPIDDVLKFSFVEAGESDEIYPNTNIKEVEFIISQLKELKEKDRNLSVGIITPHTNQQKLLIDMISKTIEWDYYLSKLKLKIMTFDTCQGEERDIIYYSMVASSFLDRLWGVFIKDLSQVDIEEDGQIKAQRLNVGFSRAKECMHFVISKPVEDFNGSIGEALRHYKSILEEAKQERSVKEVDARSQKEPLVMNWFYQTTFWNEHKDDIEFIPQFEIGKYLKQLDPTYSHPEYKVDFLLLYKDEQHQDHKIIIEYDGFEDHFKKNDEVNEFNYQNYYTDSDIYRQKILEGYGYKFLRINRFNIGDNPIDTLDQRIGYLLRRPENANSLLANIEHTFNDLQTGEMRECPKCKEVKKLVDFKDNDLITGYGRFCNDCKGLITYRSEDNSKPKPILVDKNCPQCGSKMVLRSGKYGKFYGCSKFPYCRGTRKY